MDKERLFIIQKGVDDIPVISDDGKSVFFFQFPCFIKYYKMALKAKENN